jgi:hypothetical protein
MVLLRVLVGVGGPDRSGVALQDRPVVCVNGPDAVEDGISDVVAGDTSARAVRADDLEPADAARIARLVPPTPSAYHRLNPLTKLVIATIASVASFALGGYVGPVAIIVVMLVLAAAAGVIAPLVRASVLLSLRTLPYMSLTAVLTSQRVPRQVSVDLEHFIRSMQVRMS